MIEMRHCGPSTVAHSWGSLYMGAAYGWWRDNVRIYDSDTILDIEAIVIDDRGSRVSTANVDEFSPDYFGEDIVHPFGRHYHKWTSVRHCKTSGSIYNIPRPELTQYWGALNRVNVLTRNRCATFFLRSLYEDAVWNFSLRSRYGLYAGGTYDTYIMFDKVLIGGSYRNGIYAIVNTTRDIYMVNDQYSFSPYSVVTTAELSASVRRYEYVDGDNQGFRVSSAVRVKATVFTSDSPQRMAGKLVEACQLAASQVGPARSYWRDWRRLSGDLSLQVSSPNYELMFPQEERNPSWHELASAAYQNLGFADINGIAFVHDIASMGAEFTAFSKVLKSLPSSKLRGAAKAFLAVHYGFKLFLLDAKELYDTLDSLAERTSSLSKCQAVKSFVKNEVHYEARYQVFYDAYAEVRGTLHELLRISDLALTTENIWDMIPFSFIVDWFLQVGNLLTAFDNYSSLTQVHNVLACGRSIKARCSVLPSQLGLPDTAVVDDLVCSYYLRRYSKYPTLPSLLPVTVNPLNHWVEGAAIIVSRRG